MASRSVSVTSLSVPAQPGDSGRFQVHERGRVAAAYHGQTTSFIQQLGPVAGSDHEGIDATQHAQHAIEASNSRLLYLTLAAHTSILESAADSGRQPCQVALQQVIDGTTAQRRDRPLLSHGSGNENEGGIRGDFLRNLEGRQAVKLRQAEVRKNDIGSELAERLAEVRFGFHAL
jgi:hypothetical protein